MAMESVRFVVEVVHQTVIVLGTWYVIRELLVKMSQDALGVLTMLPSRMMVIGQVIGTFVSNNEIQQRSWSFFSFVCTAVVLFCYDDNVPNASLHCFSV